MANYYAYTRTNMFRVTDEEKIKEIVGSIVSEDGVELFEEVDSNGNNVFGFGSYGVIDGIPPQEPKEPSDEPNNEQWENLVKQLQSILPDGEAVIFTEVGYEKLKYVGGYTVVITNKSVESEALNNIANRVAAIMLDVPEYNAIY